VSADAYTLRHAGAEDVPALPSVETRAVRLFEDWLGETGLTLAILADVSTIEELEDARRRGHLWVATAPDGEVVAFAHVVVLDDTAHLDELDVVPEHGRRGIGSRLVEAVCHWATEAGYPSITLSTFRDVPWNRPFYEHRAFRVVDPSRLPRAHRALIDAERQRGLRTDLRVIMERRLAG
jgi:4-diphosphocytidyl-2-C-methyl-D-erythritol kinase